MKLSTLIQQLIEYRKVYGDREVEVDNGARGPIPIVDMDLVPFIHAAPGEPWPLVLMTDESLPITRRAAFQPKVRG